MKQETIDEIRQLIMDQYGCDDTFTAETALVDKPIYGDSLDNIELMMAIEDHFDLDLGDDVGENWVTVQDVFDSIEVTTGE